MRRADSRERCHVWRKSKLRYRIAAVKSALGVGYNIDLLASVALHDELDPVRQLPRALPHRKCGLVIAVVDHRTVGFERARDPAPIIEQLIVAEEHTVDEHDRIFRFAIVAQCGIRRDDLLLHLKLDLLRGDADYPSEDDQVSDRDHSAQRTYHAPLHAHLRGHEVNANYTVPEEYRGQHRAVNGAEENIEVCGRIREHAESDMAEHRRNKRARKQCKNRRAVVAQTEPPVLRSDEAHTRVDVQENERGYYPDQIKKRQLEEHKSVQHSAEQYEIDCIL